MELCNRVLKKMGIQGHKKGRYAYNLKDVKVILETSLDEVLVLLSEGQRIELRGFGSFCVKNRKARIGRNPRTGQVVSIPEYKVPHFKFSKDARGCFEEKIKQNT
jgi:integration host factor subunit beta